LGTYKANFYLGSSGTFFAARMKEKGFLYVQEKLHVFYTRKTISSLCSHAKNFARPFKKEFAVKINL